MRLLLPIRMQHLLVVTRISRACTWYQHHNPLHPTPYPTDRQSAKSLERAHAREKAAAYSWRRTACRGSSFAKVYDEVEECGKPEEAAAKLAVAAAEKNRRRKEQEVTYNETLCKKKERGDATR